MSAARRFLVVGGGAAGVIAAGRLLRPAGEDRVVTVVERAPEVGPGLAYRTTDPHHLVNNYAARMSALVNADVVASLSCPALV